MKKEDLDFFKQWFLSYVNQFSSSDTFVQDNIKRKIKHTVRVCEDILLLSKLENIGEEGCRLAETIALFHDLGRFEQFMKYKTFKDSESENHAHLSVKILRKTRILSSLPPKEKIIILKAVEYHNQVEIPECLKSSKELFLYLKLIRDADKLDILRISSEVYKKEGRNRSPAFEHYLPNTSGYSEPIVANILNNRMIKIEDAKNLNDMKLLRLSYVFDINFATTIAILKNQGYISKIISSMPPTKEIYIIEKHIENYLDQKEYDTKITPSEA